MSKIIKPLLVVAAIAVNVIPGVGQALSAGIVTAITSAGISAGIGLAASALGLGPKSPEVSPAARDRLFANVDPATPRKIVFGRTAMATDIRYQEWVGANQDYLHQIVAVASHKVEAIEEVYLDDKLAWTASGGAQGEFVGYLTITARTEGTAANTVTIGTGSKWGSSRRLTGCAYLHMVFKATGNSKTKESPFSQSIPSRMTVVGKGMPVYDPRYDSTAGGSGSQRADDQTTWEFTTASNSGRNGTLQLLSYLLGWRINGKLAVGRGIPADRFNMAEWITAANACDEAVTLAAGGTEPRYRCDGIFSESDDPRQVIDSFEAAMNGKLRDGGGRFTFTIISNDLASPKIAFDDSDVLDEFDWSPKAPIERQYNEIRGKFTDPRPVSLYQLVDYPRYREAPIDGIERTLPFDLPLVQSGSQAQRLAKQQFARMKYQGRFVADFGPRAWAVQLGDVVTLTFSTLGWSNKLFRVVEHGIRADGVCPLVLQEEHADIYLWDADERPLVQPVELTPYDAQLSVLIQMLGADQLEYVDGTPIEDLKPAAPGATANVPRGDYDDDTTYLPGDMVAWPEADGGDGNVYIRIGSGPTTGVAPSDAMYWMIFVASGVGTPGADAVAAYSTPPTVQVPSYASGVVESYSSVTGLIKVFSGATDVSGNFALSTQENPQSLTISYTGRTWSVTGGFDAGESVASFTVRATGSGGFAGQAYDVVITLTKLKGSYAIIEDGDPLPTDDTLGPLIVRRNSNPALEGLYRWDGAAYVKHLDTNSAINTAKLAGKVALENMAIGVGGNMLAGAIPGANPHYYIQPMHNPSGITLSSNGQGGTALSPIYGGGAWPGSNWTMPDNGTFAFHQPSAVNDVINLEFFRLKDRNGTKEPYIPIEAGKTYEASCYLQAHRCTAQMSIAWFDAAGVFLGQVSGTHALPEQGDAKTLDKYGRSVIRAAAPANARTAYVFILKGGTSPGASDSWVFGYRPFFGETVVDATAALPWSMPAQGLIIGDAIAVNTIEGNAIKTKSLTAEQVIIEQGNLTPDPLYRVRSKWQTHYESPSFGGQATLETGTVGWYTEELTDSAGTGANTSVVGNRYVALWEGRAGQNNNYRYFILGDDPALRVPIKAGETIGLRVGAQNDSNQWVAVWMQCFRADGAFLGNLGGTEMYWNAGETSIKSMQGTAPADTAYGRWVIVNQGQVYGGPTFTGAIRVGKLEANRAIGASLMVAGIIQAYHMATEFFESDEIVAAILSAAIANFTSLSSLSANFGTMTAGVAQSVDGRFKIDFNAGRLEVRNESNEVVLEVGYLS